MKNRSYTVYYRFLRYKVNSFCNKEIARQKKEAEKKAPPFCIECKHFRQEKNLSPRCIRDIGKLKDIDIVTGKQILFSFDDAPYCSSERIAFESAERRREHCCLDAQFFVRKNVEVAEQPDQKDK